MKGREPMRKRLSGFRKPVLRSRRRLRRRLLPRVSGMRLAHVIPNSITLVATCSGLLGLLFALKGEWGIAVVGVLLAAVFDVLDGRMARVLGSASDFGAELDSLSDVIAFGVCPSMIVYLWGMEKAGSFGVIGVLVFVACCLLRLARFNVKPSSLDGKDKGSLVWSSYFQGVPSTMAGCVVLMPVVLDLAWKDVDVMGVSEWMPFVLVIFCITLGILMISSVPVFTLKSVRVPKNVALYAMAAGVPLVIATLASRPWELLLGLQLLSLLTLPFSVYRLTRLRKAVEALKEEEEKEEGDSVVSLVKGDKG